MRLFLPLALAFVLFGAGLANALTVSSVGAPTVPDPTTIPQYSNANNGQSTGVVSWTAGTNEAPVASGRRDAGQTWRHGSPITLDKITVLMNPLLNAATIDGAAIQIRLYTMGVSDGVNAPSAPLTGNPGTPFLTENATLPVGGWANNTARYLTFDVTDTALAGVQDYGFFISFTGGPNAGLDARLIGHGTSASYPTGHQEDFNYWDPTGPDYDGVGDELEFYIHAVVPEPSSFVLAGMGLVGLVAVVRRRNRA